MRLKPEWKQRMSDNRLLILSCFPSKFRRSTVELARQRNMFVAAIADKILVPHATEGSRTLELAKMISEWGKPLFTFDTKANRQLLRLGAQPMEKW